MASAQALIESVDALRGAEVASLHWDQAERRFYLDLKEGKLVFLEVCSVFLTTDAIGDALKIYEARIVEENTERVVAEIKFRPGGTLTVNCGRIVLGE